MKPVNQHSVNYPRKRRYVRLLGTDRRHNRYFVLGDHDGNPLFVAVHKFDLPVYQVDCNVLYSETDSPISAQMIPTQNCCGLGRCAPLRTPRAATPQRAVVGLLCGGKADARRILWTSHSSFRPCARLVAQALFTTSDKALLREVRADVSLIQRRILPYLHK